MGQSWSQENQGAKAEHLGCCGCRAMGTLLAGTARNESRVGACLSLRFNCFFPRSSPVGFPLHLDQTVSGAFWQWGSPVPAPTGRMPKVSCWTCPCPTSGRAGHGGIHARWLLGCPTRPQHPHHPPGPCSKGRTTVREGLLVLTPILVTCLSA